ncbi:MAG: hypothetical protein H0U76_02020 [Ktedonobacteraceae bacterium]|nr:hypothetical protein [Ktedonobacteraceae bacterium]
MAGEYLHEDLTRYHDAVLMAHRRRSRLRAKQTQRAALAPPTDAGTEADVIAAPADGVWDDDFDHDDE